MRSRRFLPEQVLGWLLKATLILSLSGILGGCGLTRRLFPAPPPAPPEWARLTLLEPVEVRVEVMDDLGVHVDQTVTVPRGWRLLKPRPPSPGMLPPGIPSQEEIDRASKVRP